jgi:hypothetical protein
MIDVYWFSNPTDFLWPALDLYMCAFFSQIRSTNLFKMARPRLTSHRICIYPIDDKKNFRLKFFSGVSQESIEQSTP